MFKQCVSVSHPGGVWGMPPPERFECKLTKMGGKCSTNVATNEITIPDGAIDDSCNAEHHDMRFDKIIKV